MIGDIDQGSVARGLALQQTDGLGDELIGIENGVVIAVGDLLIAATAQLRTVASWCVAAELFGIARVVARPVIAEWMQHHQQIADVLIDLRLQMLQQDFVVAEPAIAKIGIVSGIQLFKRQAGADTFAASLVVAPKRGDASMIEHMQQRFFRADA